LQKVYVDFGLLLAVLETLFVVFPGFLQVGFVAGFELDEIALLVAQLFVPIEEVSFFVLQVVSFDQGDQHSSYQLNYLFDPRHRILFDLNRVLCQVQRECAVGILFALESQFVQLPPALIHREFERVSQRLRFGLHQRHLLFHAQLGVQKFQLGLLRQL